MQMVTGERSRDILMVLLAPSITNAKRKIHPACLTFKLHPFSLNEGGGGGLEGNKVEKKNTFLQRTYNVLEPTSTNTTSTSAWSLRNSWMQYITLTLPCLDSGRWGPEREEHTGWAVAEVKVSEPHRRVQKRESLRGLHFCLYFKLFVHRETAKNLRNPRRHFKRFETIISYFKNKDHFLWLIFYNVHICQRGYASRRRVT